MVMKCVILEAFYGTVSNKITIAKDFLKDLEKIFAKNQKVEISTLLANRFSMRYKRKGNIREYIIKMSHIALKIGHSSWNYLRTY